MSVDRRRWRWPSPAASLAWLRRSSSQTRQVNAQPASADAGAGSSEGAAKEAARQAREAAALRGLTAHLLEKWEVPEALHSALSFVDGPPEPDP